MVINLRTLNRKNPGSNPLAAVSKLREFHSLHVASVHSVVQMNTWLYTVVDRCDIIVIAQYLKRG